MAETEIAGVFSSDLIIESAIRAGIADLRDKPYLLDFVFANLKQDALTSARYGGKQLEQAKKWFLSHDVPVFSTTRQDEAKFPCIAISLDESSEAEATLGDVHYIPQETGEGDWPVLAGPFAAKAYSASTGLFKFPTDVASEVAPVAGMFLIDRLGNQHEIVEVLDEDTVQIAIGSNADFGTAFLKAAQPKVVRTIESLQFRETYTIRLYVHSEPSHLAYLYSVITFILLRYKETLLEARGFERSTMAWTGAQRDREGNDAELVFTRQCRLTGYVRQSWPKFIGDAKTLQISAITLSNLESTESVIITDDGMTAVEALAQSSECNCVAAILPSDDDPQDVSTVASPGDSDRYSRANHVHKGDGRVKVTSVDAILDYLSSKIVAGANIQVNVLNPGANETLEIVGLTSVQADTVATWDLTLVRYFLVDQLNGDDSNVGYVDAVGGSTLVPAGLAKKTIAGMMAIFPRNGAGRDFNILVRNADHTNGTQYNEDLDLSGCHGYRRGWLRGSTDLTNSTVDQVACGARIGQAGPNLDGSWTVQSATTADITIAAGTLGAEVIAGGSTGGVQGMRIRRIDTNAVIGGLIYRNSSSFIETGTSIVAPANGVTFWIERPGFLLRSFQAPGYLGLSTGISFGNVLQFQCVGVGITGTTQASFGIGRSLSGEQYSFCEAVTNTQSQVVRTRTTNGNVVFSSNFRTENESVVLTVGGSRFNSSIFIQATTISITGGAFAMCRTYTGGSVFNNVFTSASLDIASGNTLRGVTIWSGGLQFAGLGSVIGNNSLTSAVRRVRVLGRGLALYGTLSLVGVEFENISVAAGLIYVGIQQTAGVYANNFITLENVRNGAAGGNTGVALDISGAVNSTIVVGRGAGSVVDIVGTAGQQISFGTTGGSVLGSFADLALNNIIDKAGNNVIGSAGFTVRATDQYQTDTGISAGQIMRNSGTSGQVTPAAANNATNARPIGANLTTVNAGAQCLVATAGVPFVLFSDVPAMNTPAYLSEITSPGGFAKTTLPASGNREMVLGFTTRTAAGGAYVPWNPDNIATLIP